MKKRGHKVYCVTMRFLEPVKYAIFQFEPGMVDETEEVKRDLGDLCPIIFTNRLAKRKFCEDRGVNIDI